MTHEQVLTFWFEELSEEDWFTKNDQVDLAIRQRFLEIHGAVSRNECWSWRESAHGALAEIIVLDQFSRNLFRGQPEAFAHDAHALALAQVAAAQNLDQEVDEEKRAFFYLPFMHSESRVIHAEAVRMFETLGSDEHLKYEHIHKDIIDEFGRYPHRNATLGRQSTAAELEYLAQHHEKFF